MNFDMGMFLQGTGTGLNVVSQQINYKAQADSINMQIESNELALQDRISNRSQRLTNDLQSMRVAQAARGVEGGKGVFTGIEKAAERDIRADKINTANVIQGLHAQKGMAKSSANAGSITSLAGGAFKMYDMMPGEV